MRTRRFYLIPRQRDVSAERRPDPQHEAVQLIEKRDCLSRARLSHPRTTWPTPPPCEGAPMGIPTDSIHEIEIVWTTPIAHVARLLACSFHGSNGEGESLPSSLSLRRFPLPYG